MTTEQKLSFFYELINCNYELYHWEYDRDFSLCSTNWTNPLFSGGFLVYTGLEETIRRFLAGGSDTPVILEIDGNLLWICCFELRENGYHTHLIGPAFSGRDSLLLVRRRLDSYELSVKTRAAVLKNFERIPAIPINILNQYAVMLHYCLNGRRVTAGQIVCLSNIKNREQGIYRPSDKSHAGIWYAEQQLCKMLAEGNPLYKEALLHSGSLSAGIKAEVGDSLRSNKNNLLVLLTLCSRSCIRGGLAPSVAYDLNDYYAKRIEECNSMTALSDLSSEMLEHFVSQVQETKKQSGMSAPVQNACYYIKTHITGALSLKELAGRAGYAEYYFSRKFRDEVGCSVSEFILKEKIEQAKLLLADSRESIQSISSRLHFGGRSHFYSCFQKQTGMSPSDYRKLHGRL